jgi:uncharacterized protein YgiM (DUF1202 family)
MHFIREVDMANVLGTDISIFNDQPQTPQGINFTKMKQNAGFVIVKIGQNQFVDSDFKTNWANAKNVGLPRGSYWFYDSRSDPKQQANLCAQTLGTDLGELPLFADFEETYGGPYSGWQNWKIFLDQLKSLLGQKEIGIYSAYFYWHDNAPNPTTQASDLQYFHQYPLWIANYGVQTPNIPAPWSASEWLFWQYTDTGDGPTYGAESAKIDLNYFNGDLNAFNQRFNLGGNPPPPIPNPVGTVYQVTAVVLNIRSGPGTNYNIIGTVQKSDRVVCIGANADQSWIEIRRADGFIGWCFAQYLQPVNAPPPPPPPPIIVSPQYQVTAVGLNIRSGPGTSYSIAGTLKQNDIVAGLSANSDASWIQIKRSDGLVGWCFAQYLTPTNSPPSPPPPPVPVSAHYQVTAYGLNIRSGPGTSYSLVGTLKQNDIVAGISANSDSSWIQIQRSDGLTGWCSAQYLTPVN